MDINKTILIIDDDKINIASLTHFLSPFYEILMATDGIMGIEEAEKHLPDMILLDVIIPGMDGFEVITKLKSSEATKNIPVIFMSGLSSTDDEGKALVLGAVDFITKPFNELIVKTRIKTQLRNAEYIRIIESLCKLLQIKQDAADSSIEDEEMEDISSLNDLVADVRKMLSSLK